ncbi:TIGR00153 family protein [Testudinibacter aquarius]|uniref:TIGR00153 family protein n=1 Tax=Testudinibacter aquarius TaxID=1524974 RepID=A0A4R3Y4B8_9PAST|nr:TIGR00153 family protein [Testudinibacter aquarius]TNG95593.1 TIGR00153 family protein [Pasteurellaceae bacterium USgator41]TNG96268.1 TIGR00153 family protein [Pasteurellaceae bacterium UScroc12]TNG98856.1 TIGR00153 family protein [Pasteurellaceae bacterium UScroc31]TNG99178.1 TIGR00153 family protein [Pasteurellaceae bacterium USgator11]KAE9528000.1 phosphate transport regulator [Testudinibacter aquarius]
MPLNNILGLFAQSPLKPLEKHSNKVSECCDILVPFFKATFENDWTLAEELRKKISDAEREADSLKREIRLKLPRGLFMPLDRTDLLELVTQQDKLANYAKDIAGRAVGRHLCIPQPMQQAFLEYLNRSLDAAHQATRVIQEMDELLETGFKGRELNFVNKMINELDAIEDDTDHQQILLRRQLLEIEDQYKPVDVIFLYKILEWIGVLADQAQRVGSRIELMLARS